MQSWNPGGWNTLLHHGSALEVVVYLFKTFNVGHTQKITGIIHTCGALFTCSTDKTVKVLEPNFNPGLISNLSDITAEVAEVRLYSISIHYSTYIEYLAIHLTHNNFSIYECCDKWSHCLSLSLCTYSCQKKAIIYPSLNAQWGLFFPGGSFKFSIISVRTIVNGRLYKLFISPILFSPHSNIYFI